MSRNITLQQATPGDIPLIRLLAQRIWLAHYPSVIGEKQVTYMLDKIYSLEALQHQMEAEGQMFRLVMEADTVLGFISVSDKGEGNYFLNKFYLDNDQRGKGLGKAVFERILDYYPGLRTMRLTVNRQNYKSINFYFRIGFTIEKCLDIPIGDGYEMNDFQMVFLR